MKGEFEQHGRFYIPSTSHTDTLPTIRVCDAIMGSGKSSAAINYINEHPDMRFVYITPYLDEAKRIYDGCPDANFVEPSNKLSNYNFSKLEHTKCLLRDGSNISTTHAAFKFYTMDMIENIKKWGYTLLIDEAVDTFHEAQYKPGDIKLLTKAGLAEVDDMGLLHPTGEEYDGARMKDIYLSMQCGNLININTSEKDRHYYYWSIPIDILSAFSDVIVMTYIFRQSDFRFFLDIYKVPYKYIGIHFDGTYHFCDAPDYIPEYTKTLGDKIHICDSKKLNDVGNNYYAISTNWLKTHDRETDILKRNLYNYFRGYHRNLTSEQIMWTTFKSRVRSVQGKGYTKQWVPYNIKASNEYRNKTVLAYCVNVFASPQKNELFSEFGETYGSDMAALSTMVQWIWRSAIRDGKEIDIYIPSRRMRELLCGWIKYVSEGGVYCA